MAEAPAQAIILAGGFGTRLRPLTLSCPKPLVPFLNMPILEHQVAALVKVNVSTIVLAVSYQPEKMEWFVKKCKDKYGVDLIFSIEEEPLGTAGPLALAKQYITSPHFFVLNSDVTCVYPFTELLKFHKSHGGEGTLVVTQVKEPSKYGVILSDANGKIERFVEKPKEFVGDQINAGLYCFSREILDRIQPVKTSIEREIFPKIVEEGKLFSFALQSFWMDIGQPKDYLAGTKLHLAYLEEKNMADDAGEKHVLVDSSAQIGNNCKIGPNVVIAPGCVIEDGVRIRDSVLFEGTKVKRGAFVKDCIIGWECTIGEWTRLEDLCVLERDVTIKPERHLRGAKVCSHKSIDYDVRESTNVL